LQTDRRQREADIHLGMMRSGKFIHKLLGRNTDMNALLMGAQIMSSMEECALGMEQRSNYAAVKGAQIKSSKGECALDMGQRSNDAAVKDAQTKQSKEECALSMGQRSNDEAVKDAQM